MPSLSEDLDRFDPYEWEVIFREKQKTWEYLNTFFSAILPLTIISMFIAPIVHFITYTLPNVININLLEFLIANFIVTYILTFLWYLSFIKALPPHQFQTILPNSHIREPHQKATVRFFGWATLWILAFLSCAILRFNFQNIEALIIICLHSLLFIYPIYYRKAWIERKAPA